MEQIRVGFLMSRIAYGGAAKSLVLLLKSLESYNIFKVVFAIGCNAEDLKQEISELAENVEIVKIEQITYCQAYHSSYYNFFRELNKDYSWFVDLLKRQNINILHINSSVFPHIHRWVKKNSEIKIITHVREVIPYKGFSIRQKFIVNNIYRYSDAIVTISENEVIPFKSFHNLHIIPNPFNFNDIVKVDCDFRRENFIDRDILLVGMMGHFVFSKGHLDFIEAMRIVLERFPSKQIKFIILGVSSQKPWWKLVIKKFLFVKDLRSEMIKYIKKFQLEESFLLLPPTKDVFPFLKSINVYVRPSLAGDPWGRDIIEAMAMKRPVVATGVSDFYIKDGITGYLVPPNDPIQIASRVTELLYNKEKSCEFGIEAYQLIKRKCEIGKFGEQLFGIYRQIL